MSSPTELVTPVLLRSWRLPGGGQSKHERGNVLVIGGARKTPGAAMLAGLAALRAGAGRLSLAVAESAAVSVAVAVPESAVFGMPENSAGSVDPSGLELLEELLSSMDVVTVGPGLDDPELTADLLRGIGRLLNAESGIVLDAFALGVLSGLPDIYQQWAGRLILTPNLREAAFLLQRDTGDLTQDTTEIASRYGAVVSCQGIVAAPGGQIWSIAAGNPGLGTSGSGDVLAGAVSGFLARGADPAQAACWGSYAHACAGDRLAARIGPTNFLARELLDELPRVLAEIGQAGA